MQRVSSDMKKDRLERAGAVLACLLAAVLLTGPVSAQEPRGTTTGGLSIRAWQVSDYSLPYLQRMIDLAPRYDITHIEFSNHIVSYADELLVDQNRGKDVDQLAARCHRRGLKAWVWTHEFRNVPAAFLKDGKVQMDDSGLWTWLADKYAMLFDKFRNLDGLVITLHETTWKVYDDKQTVSSLAKPNRVAKLIAAINEVCKKRNKDLVVRDFAYEPEELTWIKDGLLKSDPRVIVETKEVPHEWDPYYPNNPLIGAYGQRPQIVEFHSAAEIGGCNETPYLHPEYFKMRLDYEIPRGIRGYTTRVDTGGYYHAMGTPNECNLYALFRLARDPSTSPETIWRDWAVEKYGERAAPYAIRALKRGFDISNKTYYTLGFWITNHTRFPSFQYAQQHISRRTIAKWSPETKYVNMERRLNHPDAALLEEILAEKDEAIALAQKSLADLEEGRRYFAPADFEDLNRRFRLDLNATIIWRYFNEAFFGYKAFSEHPEPVMRARVVRSLDALGRWADIQEQEFGEDIVVGQPESIRSFVKDVHGRLTPNPIKE